MSTTQQTMQIALDHHRQGRLAEAEQWYRQVLRDEPNHSDALHFLGVLAHQAGREDLAVELIGRSIVLAPTVADAHNNLAEVLRAQGRSADAELLYRRALELRQAYPEAWNNLGTLLSEQGKPQEAIHCLQQAVRFNPRYAQGQANLGRILGEQGRWEEALRALAAAVQLAPASASSLANLGLALSHAGRLTEAESACRRAVELDPQGASIRTALGAVLQRQGRLLDAVVEIRRSLAIRPNQPAALAELTRTLKGMGRLEDAESVCRRAVRLEPRSAEARNNLGAILLDQLRLDEAVSLLRQAIQLGPGFVESHRNLGKALRLMGRAEEAIQSLRQAIALKADHAEAHWDLGLCLLSMGDFSQGWAEHEWRWVSAQFPWSARSFSQPVWDGSDLGGRTILLHWEQGFGDVLQFVRYVPLVVGRGGVVLLEVQPELRALLAQVEGVKQCLAASGGPGLPPFDVHLPMMSLPRVFGTTLSDVPAQTPYVRADEGLRQSWRQKLAADPAKFKVGLAWAGRRTHANDRNRSTHLGDLAALADVKSVSFYSLQVGAAAAEAIVPPPGMKLVDCGAELTDFSHTAALVAELDLVVTVDTAMAHLAGAMAKPVWVMLPAVAEWRYMMDRQDSPWYPTMRLFRQRTAGDWGEVARRIAEELAVAVSKVRKPGRGRPGSSPSPSRRRKSGGT